MSGSVSKIEKMIKEAEEEIETIKKKRVRLLEENEEEMQSAQRRMNESINLKEYLPKMSRSQMNGHPQSKVDKSCTHIM
jgi:uncharacterized protein YbcI